MQLGCWKMLHVLEGQTTLCERADNSLCACYNRRIVIAASTVSVVKMNGNNSLILAFSPDKMTFHLEARLSVSD